MKLLLTLAVGVLLGQIETGDSISFERSTSAEIEDHPWLASIHSNGAFVCAGAIISDKIILTEAWCIAKGKLDHLKVRVGSSSLYSEGSVHRVQAVTKYRNETISAPTNVHNLAMLKLTPPMFFGLETWAVSMAKRGTSVPTGASAIVAGWGMAKKLRGTRLINIKQCADRLGTEQICTITAVQTCDTDLGGPLVIAGTLVGIQSLSSECHGSPDAIKIYTDVSEYRVWIDKSMAALNSL